MRVLLDASFLSSERQSAYGYLEAMSTRLRRYPDIHLEILGSSIFQLPSEVRGETKIHLSRLPKAPAFLKGPVRRALSRAKWSFEDFLLRHSLESGETPIFHTYFYTPPPSEKVRVVANALDLIPEKFGAEFGLQEVDRQHRPRKERCFREADRIIAISEATKKDVVEFYGVSEDKIDVSYLAVEEDFGAPVAKVDSFAEPYLLQVGGRLHHKNFMRLLEAFAKSPLHRDYLLVSAGEPWSEKEIAVVRRWGLSERVSCVPNPTRDRLRALYQGAAMLVYPSLYEGFGVPLLEAMACGTPIATTVDSGSIPEVAGDAAVYFDGRDPEAIRNAMETLVDPKVAQAVAAKGFENLRRFSWDKTAEETRRTYFKVVSEISVAQKLKPISTSAIG